MMKEEDHLPRADPSHISTPLKPSYISTYQGKFSATLEKRFFSPRGCMRGITREEFEHIREALAQTRERMAAGEAIQSRHDDAIQVLSQQITELSEETRRGIADIKGQIVEANTDKAKILYGAISAGGTVGGGIAVGLYQLIHAIYPHLFGG